MSMILPKGHLSCLSSAFRYTPAVQTNIAHTFTRIKKELTERSGADNAAPQARVEADPARGNGRFRIETVEAARRVLRSGGLHPLARLVYSRDFSDA